jgi:dUTP pyrophosphatase
LVDSLPILVTYIMSVASALSRLEVKLLSSKAVLPTRGSPFSAGLDLHAAADLVIPPNTRALVPTDLSVACPENTYARIAPRSGLALKHGIDTGAGVVDADYRGPVGVILFNFGDKDFVVKQGDRIAQLILEQIVMPDVVAVQDLSETVRGEGGFGSTGVSSHPDKKQRTVSPTNKDSNGEIVGADEASSLTSN